MLPPIADPSLFKRLLKSIWPLGAFEDAVKQDGTFALELNPNLTSSNLIAISSLEQIKGHIASCSTKGSKVLFFNSVPEVLCNP